MLLARHGADITLPSTNNSDERLLNLLVQHNEDGINDAEIDELAQLNPDALTLTREDGITLLHDACNLAHLSTIQYLLEQGLSVTSVTTDHKTLLHFAAWSGNSAFMQLLLEHGIDVNAKTTLGQTATHFAVQNNKHALRLLAESGSELMLENNRHRDICGIHAKTYPLCNSVHNMRNYGLSLSRQGVSKGAIVTALAKRLDDTLEDFIDALKWCEKVQEKSLFDAFRSEFTTLLHSEDQAMSTYRFSWQTIITNIARALTGVGLLLIAAHLIHSRVTQGRALFFSQKPRTTSEEHLTRIHQGLENISSSFRG